jgi:hypothetical protein
VGHSPLDHVRDLCVCLDHRQLGEDRRIAGLVVGGFLGRSVDLSPRVSVLYWTLGTALGILLHIVLFPAAIAHIFPQGERKDRFIDDAIRKPVSEFLASSRPTVSEAAEPAARSFDSQPAQRVAG